MLPQQSIFVLTVVGALLVLSHETMIRNMENIFSCGAFFVQFWRLSSFSLWSLGNRGNRSVVYANSRFSTNPEMGVDNDSPIDVLMY
jgi:hypothetical protein